MGMTRALPYLSDEEIVAVRARRAVVRASDAPHDLAVPRTHRPPPDDRPAGWSLRTGRITYMAVLR